MNSRFRSVKIIQWPMIFFSFFAFGFGFLISFQQEQHHVLEVGQLAWFHLCSALDLKDDMALMDGSKNLESMENILAFQMKVGSKIVASGGNDHFIPAAAGLGAAFDPPSRWNFLERSGRDPKNPRELTLVLHSAPGPFFWGFFGFASSLLTSLVLLRLRRGMASSHELSEAPRETNPRFPPEIGVARPTDFATVENNRPYLFLDKNFVIQQVSPEAAILLLKNSKDLIHCHLFDLKPDPQLIQAMERNTEVKLLIPFLSHPQLSVFLKPDPQGTLLFLECGEEGKDSQNH